MNALKVWAATIGAVAIVCGTAVALNAASKPEPVAPADEAQAPEISCTAGGWIRSMHRVAGDRYAIDLADGTTGEITTAQAAHICGLDG